MMMSKASRWVWVCVSALLALAACSGQNAASSSDQWAGPTIMASVTVEDASATDQAVKVVRSEHYEIYSTIQDRPEMLSKLAQLMEGAFGMYRTLAPTVTPTDHRMRCYMFGDRTQWMDFTRQHTGLDSNVYLQISRGGYTIHDWYVAYYIGDVATYSVAAHEGWHQFVARHFKGRLPPFLEEGLACMFEGVQWSNDNLPRFNLSMNPDRALSLRRVVDANELFPLSKLITLHAGNVVGLPGIRIEAFYSECWAFARYMWDGDNGRNRPALQQLLADTAAGTIYDPTGSLRLPYLGWNPAGVRPLLEHYLGTDLPTIEADYLQFVHKVAYDEMTEQFQMR
jgi:hypothetical protein